MKQNEKNETIERDRSQPSKETMIAMLNFFMKTSIPRLLAEKERQESQRSSSGEINEEMNDKIPKG
jgi:hypothetical protein